MTTNKINILGVSVDALTLDEAIKCLLAFSNGKKPAIICTPNTEMVVKANYDSDFKDILNSRSALNLADGFGLLWAAKFNSFPRPANKIAASIVIVLEWFFSILLIPLIPNFYKNPIPEKISGSDFIHEICRFAASNKLKLFLLGGGPTIAERTALQLQTENPDLRVAGVYSGNSDNNEEIINAITKSRADILLVAFGAPKQEKWLAENLKKTNCKIGVGLGGTFDFIAGVKKRAPVWMQKSGLEWLHRLTSEPKRIGRQLALPKFMLLILKNKLKDTSS